jgi:hypothetical protein
MAVFLFLLAILGGVVVGDLVLENTAAAEVAVFNQAVIGHSEGVLLAMAAALGFIVAMLLVASVGLTETRRARRKQLHSLGPVAQGHVDEPAREHASLDEFFRRQEVLRECGEPARPTDLRHER